MGLKPIVRGQSFVEGQIVLKEVHEGSPLTSKARYLDKRQHTQANSTYIPKNLCHYFVFSQYMKEFLF